MTEPEKTPAERLEKAIELLVELSIGYPMPEEDGDKMLTAIGNIAMVRATMP